MPDLELTRSHRERRLYVLDGVGTLRFTGLGTRSATASADSRSWRFTRRGFLRRAIQATDELETLVGEFEPRSIRRGGALQWAGRELALRPASQWRERYALADGDRELAILAGKGWGRRPVQVTVDNAEPVEPGLLLFAAFIVRGLAADADSTAAAGSTTASAG